MPLALAGAPLDTYLLLTLPPVENSVNQEGSHTTEPGNPSEVSGKRI